MFTHPIEFSAEAYRHFAELDASARRRLSPTIGLLAVEPRPHGAARLDAESELWRVRVRGYRIVYAIEGERIVVLAVRLGRHRESYRAL